MYSRVLTSSLLVASAYAVGELGFAAGPPGAGTPDANGQLGIAAGLPDSQMQGQMQEAAQQVAEGQGQPQVQAVQAGPGEVVKQTVLVGDGNGSLRFYPENIQAEVGTWLEFQFQPKAHGVAESSFDNPCVPKDEALATEQRPGVRTGPMPTTFEDETTPTFMLQINDTEPMWLYCSKEPHCQKGMVMVVNQNPASQEKTLEKYREAAMALPVQAPPPENAAAPGEAAAPSAGTAPENTVAGAEPSAAGGAPIPEAEAGNQAANPVGGEVGGEVAAGAQGTGTEEGPATFTGAASREQVHLAGAVFAAGAMVALL